MRYSIKCFLIIAIFSNATVSIGQDNSRLTQVKIKNYLPHMTVPEVEDLLTKTDMVIIPVGALEQHGKHLPIGTDFLNGVERSILIAQQSEVMVAPVLMAGQSPYHMGFAGSITLSAETIIQVHMEAVESLIRHGFKRFLISNAHGGNRAICNLIVDQINQTTEGIAVDLNVALGPFRQKLDIEAPKIFDRHGGVSETSRSMYLIPDLVQMDKAVTAELTLPPHMERMLPDVVAKDPTALRVFLAEGLKAEETGKGTSSSEMSTTGVWGLRDLQEASVEQGKAEIDNYVDAAIKFIERWNELRPPHTKN